MNISFDGASHFRLSSPPSAHFETVSGSSSNSSSRGAHESVRSLSLSLSFATHLFSYSKEPQAFAVLFSVQCVLDTHIWTCMNTRPFIPIQRYTGKPKIVCLHMFASNQLDSRICFSMQCSGKRCDEI